MMPAGIITLHAKNKMDLKKRYDKAIKDASKQGMSYVLGVMMKEGLKKQRVGLN